MLTMWLESCYGCIPAFSRDMPRLLSSGRDFVYLHIVRRVSRLMKIPQECCNTLGVLLKTNGSISPLILTRGWNGVSKCVRSRLSRNMSIPNIVSVIGSRSMA